MATINDAGFAIKTLREYLSQIESAYYDIDQGWNLEPESPDGMAIRIWSELFANLDEVVASAYHSVDPATAVGVQLDRIARISGLDRQDATASTATVTFTGTSGTSIPSGTGVRNVETDTIWETEQSVTIPDGGSVDVGVACTTLGAEPAGAGDLSELANPIGGVSSVTNDASASLGRDRESDPAFRSRRRNSVAAPSQNQIESILGSVANVDGVKAARVYENDTGAVDSNGLDGHSMAVFADGGDSTEILQAIANNKNPGAGLNVGAALGSTEVSDIVLTDSGNPLSITFFRPTAVDIYILVEVDSDISTDTEDALKSAIVEYANSELAEVSGGFDLTGFGVGDTVVAGRLFTPANSVIGESTSVSSIQVGTTSGEENQVKVDPGFDGLPVFSEANITVSVT